jgi:type I restriction enzyme, R subunit
MKTSTHPDYCVRVTANDGAIGEAFLRTFQDNEKTIPTILTTSQKLSTGVDARNVRNIVLMRPVKSMIEFKQIIGRGTRLYEGKDYFTILDFVKAYEHFNDPEWDGEPMAPEPPIGGPKPPGGPPEPPTPPEPPGEPVQKIKIKLADGKERTIQHISATSFWGPDGKPMSAAQFIAELFGALPALFKDEEELRRLWSQPDTRKALLESLAERGFGGEQLSAIRDVIDAAQSDVFDVLAYVAFALQPLTRAERVKSRKPTIMPLYDAKLQGFIDFVLQQYVAQGVDETDTGKLVGLLELKYHSTSDAAAELGGVKTIREAFVGFQKHLYERNASIG